MLCFLIASPEIYNWKTVLHIGFRRIENNYLLVNSIRKISCFDGLSDVAASRTTSAKVTQYYEITEKGSDLYKILALTMIFSSKHMQLVSLSQLRYQEEQQIQK